MTPPTFAQCLLTIVSLLEELASFLQPSNHSVVPDLEKSVAAGRGFVTSLAPSSPAAPDAAKLQEYFAGLVAILDAIEYPLAEKPERKEFWL
jgi:hypothetical protein